MSFTLGNNQFCDEYNYGRHACHCLFHAKENVYEVVHKAIIFSGLSLIVAYEFSVNYKRIKWVASEMKYGSVSKHQHELHNILHKWQKFGRFSFPLIMLVFAVAYLQLRASYSSVNANTLNNRLRVPSSHKLIRWATLKTLRNFTRPTRDLHENCVLLAQLVHSVNVPILLLRF